MEQQKTAQPESVPSYPPEGVEGHHGKHDGRKGDNHEYRRCSGGRTLAYYLFTVLLNVLLGVYLLYAVGMVMELDLPNLQEGASRSILQSIFQVLLLISPAILTVLFNRLLFRLFRGRRCFPRGTAFFALLLVLAVQTITVFGILSYGFIGGIQGFSIDSVTALLPS